LAEFEGMDEADVVYEAGEFVSAIVPTTRVLDGQVSKNHTNCLTSGRASGCECRLCCRHIATADACDRLLDLMAVGTADGCKVCRVWLLVDGRKKTCRRSGKDTA
jgi:hypothetical protein